uniref:C2H2-type domain-containing protein n=1 Tax=Plectus sambesii TaxID=2011161 RepID=A0A914XBM7_9BILA
MEHLAVVKDVIRDIVTRIELLETAEIETKNAVEEVGFLSNTAGYRTHELPQRVAKKAARKRGRLADRELGRLEFEKPVAYQQLFDGCVTCETCDASFSSPTQLISHEALFHRDAAADESLIVDYHCCSCNNSFDALAGLLLHVGCVDARKLRLAAGDMAVCLLCGWAVKRAHLFDHLIVDHSKELTDKLPQTFPIECRFCSSTSLLKSAHEWLFHTAVWHSANIAIRLRRLDPPQLCQLCNEYIPADEFRRHVVSVHISAAKERQSPPSEPRREAKAKKSFVHRNKIDSTIDSIESVVSAVVAERRASEPFKSAVQVQFGLRCAGCPKKFESGSALAKHKVMQECQASSRTMCPFCIGNDRSVLNRQLWTHVMADHDYRMLQAMGTSRDNWPRQVCGVGKEYRGRGPIACAFCPLQFQHRDTRRLHIALLHVDKNSINAHRPQSADPSASSPDKKRFVFPATLTSSISSSPDFRCQRCGAKFHTDFSLRLHQQTFHDAVSEQNSVLQRVLLAANNTTGTQFRLDDSVLGGFSTATNDYWKMFVKQRTS